MQAGCYGTGRSSSPEGGNTIAPGSDGIRNAGMARGVVVLAGLSALVVFAAGGLGL